MKRKILQFSTLFLIFITSLVSCKKEESVDGIILDKTLWLAVGKTATLTVTFIPNSATNKKVIWESSATQVATVENGTVTGIARGEAKITVISQDGGRRAQCMVSVLQPIEPELIWVEGGTFTMGCTSEQGEDCSDGAKPAHEVTLSSFYIGKYEVTQKEWIAAMRDNPSFDKGDDIPVHDITFDNVKEYIRRLNAVTGKNYRLLTEAEWEYAARGGRKSQHYKYSGSNDVNEVAWYSENAHMYVREVGEKKANELGIYDMSGNVSEWCSDWVGIYTEEAQINPSGPATGNVKILRGGSSYWSADWCCVSLRAFLPQKYEKSIDIGFRLALPAEQKKE